MKIISDIKVGYACNNNCMHCVIAHSRETLNKQKKPINRTFDECKKEILEAKKEGAEEIVLTGGEPTIRKDFLKLLNLIKEQCLYVILQTNGRYFKDFEFSEEVATYPIRLYGIALHGPSSEVHDKITRRKGSFAETVEGIENLVKLRRYVQIKYVMSKLNYEVIDKTIDLMERLEVKSINLTFPHGIGNAGKYFDKVVPKYSEVNTHVKKAYETCRQKGILFETEAIPYCFLRGYEECASEHFLQNASIETRPVGRDKLNWSEKRLEIKRKGKQCYEDCLYSKVCEGPWEEYIEYYGDSEFKPITASAKNMLEILVKYKTVMDIRAGKIKIDEKGICPEDNK